MIRRIRFSRVVAIFFLGLILGAGTIAYAGTAYSPWGYYGPFLGYNYRNQADVSLYGYYANAHTAVEENPWEDGVPAGYMGAQAFLYLNGSVIKSTSMRYNNSDGTLRWVSSTGDYFGQGTYYSKGITAAKNGSGYKTYYTFQSPSQNTD